MFINVDEPRRGTVVVSAIISALKPYSISLFALRGFAHGRLLFTAFTGSDFCHTPNLFPHFFSAVTIRADVWEQ